MTLEVVDLTHRYGDELVLEDISFEVETGEIIGLLGPSGCGKTTTVQAIAGHVNPTAGRIHLRGEDITADPPERRDIGVVFQEPTLFPHMTVGENVAYGLRPAGFDPDERAATVDRYLELVSLSEQREAMPAALSGGQKRRVELARALAPQPDVLLLDEPLSALDRGLRDQLREEIARIQRETGVTTLYVTHDQETAMALSDRLVVMADGAIAGVGEPRKLYESPSTPFVASFLGRSTRLPLTPPGDPGLTLESRALAGDGGTPADTGRICLARPSNLTLLDSEQPKAEYTLAGVVERVTDLGTRYEVVLTLDAGGKLTVETQRVQLESGDRARCTIDGTDLLLFEELPERVGPVY